MLSRIINSFVLGLNKNAKDGRIPTYVIIVLDDDLITFLNFNEDGVATLLGSWVQYLASKFNEKLEKRKDQVPLKCKKEDTFFYWVAPPLHSCFSKSRNDLRVKFNLSLDSVIRTQPNMRIIRLKEMWDPNNSQLVVKDRMTEVGLTTYWSAVDASFKFNSRRRNVYLAKKLYDTSLGSNNKNYNNTATSTATTDESRGIQLFEAGRDPMMGFFRRNRDNSNVEHQMGVREDGHRRHVNNRNRFFLPRPDGRR